MKISKQIDKIQRLGKGLVDEYVDYLSVLIEHNVEENFWTAVLIYENSGDEYPSYVDAVIPNGRLMIDGSGRTIVSALRNLEKCIIENLKALKTR